MLSKTSVFTSPLPISVLKLLSFSQDAYTIDIIDMIKDNDRQDASGVYWDMKASSSTDNPASVVSIGLAPALPNCSRVTLRTACSS